MVIFERQSRTAWCESSGV